MEHPSELQQLQRPNKPGASAPGTSGHSGVGSRMTSGSSGEPSPMIGEVGDGPSWYDQVSREEAKKGACKRTKEQTLNSRHWVVPSPWVLSQTGKSQWMPSMSTWQAKNHLRGTLPCRPSAHITLSSLPLLQRWWQVRYSV